MISSRIISKSIQNILIWQVTENVSLFLLISDLRYFEMTTELIWGATLNYWELELVNESQLGEAQMIFLPEILLMCTWGLLWFSNWIFYSSWIFKRKYQFTFSVYMAGVLRGPLRYDWHDNCRAQTLNEAALSPSIIILALKFRAAGAWVGGGGRLGEPFPSHVGAKSKNQSLKKLLWNTIST